MPLSAKSANICFINEFLFSNSSIVFNAENDGTVRIVMKDNIPKSFFIDQSYTQFLCESVV